MAPAKEASGANCPCPKTKCKRHGDCAACQAHHAEGKSATYCQRK